MTKSKSDRREQSRQLVAKLAADRKAQGLVRLPTRWVPAHKKEEVLRLLDLVIDHVNKKPGLGGFSASVVEVLTQ